MRIVVTLFEAIQMFKWWNGKKETQDYSHGALQSQSFNLKKGDSFELRWLKWFT